MIILDVSKALDTVGHKHIHNKPSSLNIPLNLRNIIDSLITSNSTQFETSDGKTKHVKMCRGNFPRIIPIPYPV